jgi:hypothetical protein
MKKILSLLLAFTLVSANISSVFAVNTILPGGADTESSYLSEADCSKLVDQFMEDYYRDGTVGMPDGVFTITYKISENVTASYDITSEDVFSCAIKSGNIKFWMVPYFVKSILQWLLTISGLIAVLMTIIGGYYYIMGGLTEDKEKGKTIIQYALGGMALATLSWIIVNLILLAVTS